MKELLITNGYGQNSYAHDWQSLSLSRSHYKYNQKEITKQVKFHKKILLICS